MNALVLNPGALKLEYALFKGKEPTALCSGQVADYRGEAQCRAALQSVLQGCRQSLAPQTRPQTWALRVPYGGSIFTGTVKLDKAVVAALTTLVPQSPLRLPPILQLLNILPSLADSAPVSLVFESAFFANLPTREALYALNDELLAGGALRRYGAHGIFHSAACARVVQQHKVRPAGAPLKILSLCLEPQPEVAAVLGNRPLMTSGGASPLEGLPGPTTCGELDAGIITMLSATLQWGPERIARLLTRESGLLGLGHSGRSLSQLWGAGASAPKLAREVMEYRLLLACGAGIAALGGLQHMVFSGRYAALGTTLGPLLLQRIMASRRAGAEDISCSCYPNSLGRLLADQAMTMLLGLSKPRAAARSASAQRTKKP